jgi:hypothetical protein
VSGFRCQQNLFRISDLKTHNTRYKTQNTKHQTQNTKLESYSFSSSSSTPFRKLLHKFTDFDYEVEDDDEDEDDLNKIEWLNTKNDFCHLSSVF